MVVHGEKMTDKIQILLYNFIGKFSDRWKKIFLWLAGFRNIERMEIVCRQGFYTTTFTMKKDGVIHKIINMWTVINEKI